MFLLVWKVYCGSLQKANIFHLSFVIHDVNDFIAFCVFGMIYGIQALMHRFMHVMLSGSIYMNPLEENQRKRMFPWSLRPGETKIQFVSGL